MNGLSKDSVTWIDVPGEMAGQRVDNFLLRLLKGVPKSHVYRILRSGEVRVNSRRAAPTQKLEAGDRLRIPPIRTSADSASPPRAVPRMNLPVLFEDNVVLAIDKPAGAAVHGGSGVSAGVIEALRAARPDEVFLELVHRLDRETSGVLLLARRRAALVDLHAQIREGTTDKRYLALVHGALTGGTRKIDLPLSRHLLEGGDRRVSVDPDGLPARTIVKPVARFGAYTLVEAQLLTGRTHQIRVHLAHTGTPICGDDKYGDFALNKTLARDGLKRMFLHAARLTVRHPVTGDALRLEAPLPTELQSFLDRLAAGAGGRT